MRRLLSLALIAAVGLASPGFAQSLEERVIAELQRDGYCRINRTRTLLGRVRIIGLKPFYLREVVINPSTSEILRDIVLKSDKIGEVCDDD